jgi:hypothetical protein
MRYNPCLIPSGNSHFAGLEDNTGQRFEIWPLGERQPFYSDKAAMGLATFYAAEANRDGNLDNCQRVHKAR